MNNLEYQRLVELAASAIFNGESLLKVETDNKQPDFYFNLPEPQTSGTATQQIAYAFYTAKKFLSNHGINQPSIF